MKQEKGITMVSLVVIIIILSIIVGLVVNTASPLLQKSNIEDLTTELMLIQAKWKIERERVNFDGTSIFNEVTNSYGVIVYSEDDAATEDINEKGKLIEQYETNSETWIDPGVKAYYRLPNEALESMGLELEENFGYLVNYENDEIIYIPGIEDEDGKIYYKLSEIKGL